MQTARPRAARRAENRAFPAIAMAVTEDAPIPVRRQPRAYRFRGWRSIGTTVGEVPDWIAPSASKPWRS